MRFFIIKLKRIKNTFPLCQTGSPNNDMPGVGPAQEDQGQSQTVLNVDGTAIHIHLMETAATVPQGCSRAALMGEGKGGEGKGKGVSPAVH